MRTTCRVERWLARQQTSDLLSQRPPHAVMFVEPTEPAPVALGAVPSQMTFQIFSDPTVAGLVERFGEKRKFVLFAGAGTSVEAGLPTWPVLAERLLLRAAVEADLFRHLEDAADPGVRDAAIKNWIDSTLRTQSVLGAIAAADALGEGNAASWLKHALYGVDSSAADYVPGPMSEEIAELKVQLGDHISIWTTNYDDLIEEALRNIVQADQVVAWVGPNTPNYDEDKDQYETVHLHGYLGRDHEAGDIILTDRQYAEMAGSSSWQERGFGRDLDKRVCLFVGASLTDPNITRFLWRQQRIGSRGDVRHCVIFVRQAEAYGAPDEVRRPLERAVTERYQAVGLEAVFVDHFADVADVLREIRFYRGARDSYSPLNVRCSQAITEIEETLLGVYEPEQFATQQGPIRKALADALSRGIESVSSTNPGLTREPLAMSLWLFDRTGSRLSCWATTDRLNLNPVTIQSVDLDLESRWVAVKAACFGASHGQTMHGTESRWSFIRAIPLWITSAGRGRLPLGAVTVTTQAPVALTELEQMNRQALSLFDRACAGAVAQFLTDGVTVV